MLLPSLTLTKQYDTIKQDNCKQIYLTRLLQIASTAWCAIEWGIMGPCLGREHSGKKIPSAPLSSVKCPASSTSHPFVPSVAVQSLPTRTTQYARYSDSDSPTLYPQALLIPSLISLARPVQQKTTNSLEGRGPHSSSFSPLRMANKGPDAMAFKQVFNTVYFNFKLASCPTQSPSAGAVHGGVLGIGPVDASARVCLPLPRPSRFLLLFLGAGTESPPMSICWSSCGSMVAKSGP